tara:strand:- start:432 stop:644 length:213 start_codon:yes stop_codon:yes gene_type:complete
MINKKTNPNLAIIQFSNNQLGTKRTIQNPNKIAKTDDGHVIINHKRFIIIINWSIKIFLLGLGFDEASIK